MSKPTRASRVIAEWLKSGTEEDPHTQAILSVRIGARIGRTISQSTISHISRGMQQPRADIMAALRLELGIEPEWWLPDAPETGPLPKATGSGEHSLGLTARCATGTDGEQ